MSEINDYGERSLTASQIPFMLLILLVLYVIVIPVWFCLLPLYLRKVR